MSEKQEDPNVFIKPVGRKKKSCKERQVVAQFIFPVCKIPEAVGIIIFISQDQIKKQRPRA